MNDNNPKRRPIFDGGSKEVFTVEKTESGVFQSVFPSRLSQLSALHASEEDAWKYLDEMIFAENKHGVEE